MSVRKHSFYRRVLLKGESEQILELSLKGFSLQQIADLMGICKPTIERVLEWDRRKISDKRFKE